jgi:hypothetical protein
VFLFVFPISHIFIRIVKRITILLIAVTAAQYLTAQTRLITGAVLDSLTHNPLPNVTINIPHHPGGILTNANGSFRMHVAADIQKLTFTSTGYTPLTITLRNDTLQRLIVFLSKSYTELQGVLVRPKKEKYRNKNNPAVDLIRQVIANKEKNGPGAYPYTSYQQYEKIRLLLDRLPDWTINNKVMRKFHFLTENRDTTLIPGQSLIPVYIEELSSDNFYQRHPANKKKLVLGKKNVDFGEYVDMRGISTFLNRLYEDINIYDNTINIFTIQFTSPVADLAPTFYMYFIHDTITDNGIKLIRLDFTPRNPEDLLFRGTLYITLDGNYAVRKAEMGVTRHTNLNYVREFHIRQEFEQGPGERYHLATSNVLALFSVFPKSPGVVGERTVAITHVTDSIPNPKVFNGPSSDTIAKADHQPDNFWTGARTVPLDATEAKTYANTDSLIRMRSYRRLTDLVNLLSSGYKSAGKFDIGPVGNFYSFNPIEGSKLSVGGRSNTKLSTRYYTQDYVAYGLKDEKWKYFLSASYSLNNRSIYSYPLNYIQVSFLRDTRTPGQETVFAQGSTFLNSFSRGNNTQWLYNDILRLSYVHELGNHFSYNMGMKYWRQQPAGSLVYEYEPSPGVFDTVRQVTTSEVSANIRWAPHEQFYQGKNGRTGIINKYPIFTLQYTRGIQGLFGGQYHYDAFHFNLYKRFYWAPLGYSDVRFDAGYLDGSLPFPLLIIAPANISYVYSFSSYNLMNIGEFVSDHYTGLNIDHYFGGFFLNKIPLLKKWRIREVIGGKILYGGLRDINNPDINTQQMKFPLTKGLTTTYPLGSQPYIEASVGLYNIFTFLRLDLVKRYTYLDHPNVSNLGLRASANFSF